MGGFTEWNVAGLVDRCFFIRLCGAWIYFVFLFSIGGVLMWVTLGRSTAAIDRSKALD